MAIHDRLSLKAKPMTKNSTIPKPIPTVACESHNSSRKKPYTAEKALSESEINAVIQLIQLSSSADSYSDHHTDHLQEEDNSSFSFSFSKSIDAASSSYSSSSSVPAVLLRESEKGELAQEDHSDHGGGDNRSYFGERRSKRYRSIMELYKDTDETVLKKKKNAF